MKRTILTSLLMTLVITTNAQLQNSINESKSISTDFAGKAKKQKKAAWICLGGGFTLITTATIIGLTKAPEDIVSQFFYGEQPQDYTAETILTVIGTAGIVASVPLFISASKNKHRAKIGITEQKTAVGLPLNVPKKIPSLTISIPLGS